MKSKIYTLLAGFLLLGMSLVRAHNFEVLVFLPASPSSLDNTAYAAIQNLGLVHSFNVDSSSNPADLSLSHLDTTHDYAAVIFLNRNGSSLNVAQKADFESYIGLGNGFVGINSAADPTSSWTWFDSLMGAYTSTQTSSQAGTLLMVDRVHPSTKTLPQRWTVTDTWYNFATIPVGDVHVLAYLDESSISGGTNGYDHPISWCHDFESGRSWYTALGGTTAMYSDSDFLDHLVGGIEWAAGAEAGDAAATIYDSFDLSILDDSNTDPMSIDVAPDGRVFFIEKSGAIKIWKPSTNTTVSAGVQPVFPGGENGLIGMTLDHNFPTAPYIYLHYTYQDGNWGNTGPGLQRISRYTVTGDVVNIGSEEILLSYTIERAAAIHSGGCMDFDRDGNLVIATGDNTSYGAYPNTNPYAPIDDRVGNDIYDAQRSSANTKDFRGKFLRIKPSATIGGGYTIPAGNLFPATDSTLGEIYLMGVRNPFRFSIDTATNWIYWGDVGPDAVVADANRGPIGKDEFNQAKAPGFFGWPYFTGDNSAYNEYDFSTSTSGPQFNAIVPINNSANNDSGKHILPPAQPALMWMDKNTTTAEFPEFGGGNATAMAGPVYHYDPNLIEVGKLPQFFDNTLFIMDWSRNWIKLAVLDSAGDVLKIIPFVDSETWLRPMDLKVGPDGSLYLLEWDLQWGGASNPNSRIRRIKYSPEGLSPFASAVADTTSGPVSLAVQFDGSGSSDPGGSSLSYSWDFGDGSLPSTAVTPSHTYINPGVYTVILTVTNADGKSSKVTLTITAGNTEPVVTIVQPVNGGFFDWEEQVAFEVEVTDAEDGSTTSGSISCGDLNNQTLLGHDSHAHPSVIYNACTGSFAATAAGHVTTEDDIFYLFEANYTDSGAVSSGVLTGSSIHLLNPKLKQAEHFSSMSGIELSPTSDSLSVSDVSGVDDGDYIAFSPMNLLNITAITFRAAAGGNGGNIEVRKGAATGAGSQLVATATISSTGSYSTYSDVTIPVVDPVGTDTYYFVFTNAGSPTDLFNLNWILFEGTGISATLPVELISYEVEAVDNLFVKISWETTVEINNDFFQIERVKHLSDQPEVIAQHKGQGNSNWYTPYQNYDYDPYPNDSYYRLVQQDFDGARHYHSWQRVTFNRNPDNFAMQVYPNPAKEELHVNVTGIRGGLNIELFNMSGQSMMAESYRLEQTEIVNTTLNLSSLTSGIYLLRVQNEGTVYHHKVVVTH